MPEKFLVVKGYCGLGDRIHDISRALNYAIKTNRYLIVEWNDFLFGPVGTNVFYRYFKLIKHKVVKHSYRSCADIPNIKKLSIYPSCWKKNPFLHSYACYRQLPKRPRVNLNKNYPHQVIFYSGAGTKAAHELIPKHIHIRSKHFELVKPFYQSLPKPYTAVHIRQSDRKHNYKTLFPKLKKHQNILLVTDNQEVISIFQKKLGKKRIHFFPKFMGKPGKSLHHGSRGIQPNRHQIMKDILSEYYLMIHAHILYRSVGNFVSYCVGHRRKKKTIYYNRPKKK